MKSNSSFRNLKELYPDSYVQNNLIYLNQDIIVVPELIEVVSWNSNKQFYINLGLEMVRPLYVWPWELPLNSNRIINVQCPICLEYFGTKQTRSSKWYVISRNNNTKCKGCSHFIDLTGVSQKDLEINGYLIANKPIKINNKTYWECICNFNGCNRTTTVRMDTFIKGKAISCGCYQKHWTKENLSGSNNPNWNPNLTDEQRRGREYKRKETKQWRKLIFEKDNYTCQICYQYAGRLNAHHLYDYSTYPELEFDVNNGVTLCKSCHKDFHSWMGGPKISCTPEDFQEYICS